MDALQQLRDLHLPPPPAWWPPAPGWWLLAVLLTAVAAWLAWAWQRRRARRRPFHYAREELEQLRIARSTGSLDARGCVDGCSALLRRLFVHVLGQPEAAARTGAPWLALLDPHIDDADQRAALHAAFGDQRFRRGFGVDTARLIPATRRVIEALEKAA